MKRLRRTQTFDSFSTKHQPVVKVRQNEVFIVETYNIFSDIEGWKKARTTGKGRIPNVTGPIYVEGAMRGSVLKVDILDLKITNEVGGILATPGKRGFEEEMDDIKTKAVRIDKNFVYFSDSLKIPIDPNIGKIGVAPHQGEIPSNLPGPHGGNMDNKQIQKGASVYLPVFADGAYLGVGDAHSLMGDGEVLSGVESEAEVILNCEVIHDLDLTHPVVVTKDETMTVADGETLEGAFKTALFDMAKLIKDKIGLNFLDAAMLISIIGDLRICQIVNALVSVRVAVPRSILPIF